jgi:hypothetical protein
LQQLQHLKLAVNLLQQPQLLKLPVVLLQQQQVLSGLRSIWQCSSWRVCTRAATAAADAACNVACWHVRGCLQVQTSSRRRQR